MATVQTDVTERFFRVLKDVYNKKGQFHYSEIANLHGVGRRSSRALVHAGFLQKVGNDQFVSTAKIPTFLDAKRVHQLSNKVDQGKIPYKRIGQGSENQKTITQLKAFQPKQEESKTIRKRVNRTRKDTSSTYLRVLQTIENSQRTIDVIALLRKSKVANGILIILKDWGLLSKAKPGKYKWVSTKPVTIELANSLRFEIQKRNVLSRLKTDFNTKQPTFKGVPAEVLAALISQGLLKQEKNSLKFTSTDLIPVSNFLDQFYSQKQRTDNIKSIKAQTEFDFSGSDIDTDEFNALTTAIKNNSTLKNTLELALRVAKLTR